MRQCAICGIRKQYSGGKLKINLFSIGKLFKSREIEFE
jgi:hypothetical protein